MVIFALTAWVLGSVALGVLVGRGVRVADEVDAVDALIASVR